LPFDEALALSIMLNISFSVFFFMVCVGLTVLVRNVLISLFKVVWCVLAYVRLSFSRVSSRAIVTFVIFFPEYCLLFTHITCTLIVCQLIVRDVF